MASTFSLLLFCCLCLFCIADGKKRSKNKKKDKIVRPGSSASHHLPIQTHHSLHHPFDVSLPYWKYGGSTVCTQDFIRLTPNAQSRSGWIFNEFELQSSDWEIELHFEVKSDYHIGGDGMGLFIITESLHPRRNRHHNYLAGPIFGMADRFEGFGVILDTYDNDGNRDNPKIFAIKQDKDDRQEWRHDTDFAENQVQDKVDKDSEFQCTNNYRNVDRHSMIVRYVSQELHVYVKSSSSEDYEYCLSVKVGLDTTKNYYIALSGITGQVADKHDIYMLSTRYLDASDIDKINDASLRRAGYSSRVSWKRVLLWLIVTMLNVFLTYELCYEYYEFDKLTSEQLSPVILCQRLNSHIWWANIIHLIVVTLVVLAGTWTYLLLNLPFIAWRGYQWMTNNTKLEPIKLRKMRSSLDVGQTIGSAIKLIILIISIIMSIFNIFS